MLFSKKLREWDYFESKILKGMITQCKGYLRVKSISEMHGKLISVRIKKRSNSLFQNFMSIYWLTFYLKK